MIEVHETEIHSSSKHTINKSLSQVDWIIIIIAIIIDNQVSLLLYPGPPILFEESVICPGPIKLGLFLGSINVGSIHF